MGQRGRKRYESNIDAELFRLALGLLRTTYAEMAKASGYKLESVKQMANGTNPVSLRMETALANMVIGLWNESDRVHPFHNHLITIRVDGLDVTVVGGKIMGCRTAVLGGGE